VAYTEVIQDGHPCGSVPGSRLVFTDDFRERAPPVTCQVLINAVTGEVGNGATFLKLWSASSKGTRWPGEPYIPLNPIDPYSTQFVVKNENTIFDTCSVDCVCWPRRMNSGNGLSVVSPGLLPHLNHTIPRLIPGGERNEHLNQNRVLICG
jgi:hypothetical protein